MSEEGYINYDFDNEKYELFRLTVDRAMLNEVLNILSSKNHVDVTVDEYGHVGFNIPGDSQVNVRSINIIQDLIDMVVVIDFKMTDEISREEMKKLEHKKASILSTIEIVSDILTINNDSDKGDNDVEQEKPTSDN
jgi:hypothetical protein